MEKEHPKNRNKDDDLYEDENSFVHNTTGDKDRKRRKTLKTLVLSGSEMYQPGSNENACPQIGQFCPETHEQQSINVQHNHARQSQHINQSPYSGVNNLAPVAHPQERSPFVHH
jgi:hypothetical protein